MPTAVHSMTLSQVASGLALNLFFTALIFKIPERRLSEPRSCTIPQVFAVGREGSPLMQCRPLPLPHTTCNGELPPEQKIMWMRAHHIPNHLGKTKGYQSSESFSLKSTTLEMQSLYFLESGPVKALRRLIISLPDQFVTHDPDSCHALCPVHWPWISSSVDFGLLWQSPRLRD